MGRPISSADTTNVVGHVKKDSLAYQAGLLPGDEILTVDGKAVKGFNNMLKGVHALIAFGEKEKAEIKVKRQGESDPINLSVGFNLEKKGALERPDVRKIDIVPKVTPRIAGFIKNSPADLAGAKERGYNSLY